MIPPRARSNPYISIVFEKKGPYLWSRDHAHNSVPALALRNRIAVIRKDGRKRVMLWARTRAVADSQSISAVLWVGNPAGPGYGAVKLGWVRLDDLEETIYTHIGMMQ